MKNTISRDIRERPFLSGKPKALGRGKRAIVTAVMVALILALALRVVASGAINWSITFGFFFHPAILDAYMDGATIQTIKARARLARRTLTGEEAAVVSMIGQRLQKKSA